MSKTALTSIAVRYKNLARRRKVPYKLSLSELEYAIALPCCSCGRVGSNIKKTRSANQKDYPYNGIRLLNKDKGYVVGNLKIKCKACPQPESKHPYSFLPKSQQDGARRVYIRYMNGASSRNLSFKLTRDEVYALSQKCCHYCGALPNNKMKPRTKQSSVHYYSGIDRKDNTLGYLRSNCVSCCGRCNKAKGSLNYQEFISLCTLIASRIKP